VTCTNSFNLNRFFTDGLRKNTELIKSCCVHESFRIIIPIVGHLEKMWKKLVTLFFTVGILSLFLRINFKYK